MGIFFRKNTILAFFFLVINAEMAFFLLNIIEKNEKNGFNLSRIHLMPKFDFF